LVIFLPHKQDAGLNFDLFTEQRIIFTGLAIDTSKTLDEVGAEFGVTPERIREIEAKANSILWSVCTVPGMTY